MTLGSDLMAFLVVASFAIGAACGWWGRGL